MASEEVAKFNAQHLLESIANGASVPTSEKIPYEPNDVEGFLVVSTELFTGSEDLWVRVKDAKDQIKEVTEGGFFPVVDVEKEQISWESPADLSRRNRRLSATRSSAFAPELITKAYHKGSDFAYGAIEEGFFDDVDGLAYSHNAAVRIADGLVASKHEVEAEMRRERTSKPAIHIGNGRITDSLVGLEDAYIRAFVTQHTANDRLKNMLAYNGNASIFLERLQEIESLRTQGFNEFPGLLETLATHAAETEGKNSYLRDAVEQSTAQEYTIDTFLGDIFERGTSAVPAKMSKEFMGGVAAVKLLANILSLELGEQANQENIVQAMGKHFNLLTDEWKDAFAANLKAHSQKRWEAFRVMLQPYERRGRLKAKSGARMQGAVVPATKSRPGGSGKRKISSGQTTRTANLEDLTLPTQEITPISSFAILRRVMGSEKRYRLEDVGDIAALTEHDIIAKFVSKLGNDEQALTATIASYLKHLSIDPVDRINTKVLRDSRIHAVDETLQVTEVLRLRRFRPKQNTTDEAKGILNRLRILYAIGSSANKPRLLLHSVLLRDNAKYW